MENIETGYTQVCLLPSCNPEKMRKTWRDCIFFLRINNDTLHSSLLIRTGLTQSSRRFAYYTQYGSNNMTVVNYNLSASVCTTLQLHGLLCIIKPLKKTQLSFTRLLQFRSGFYLFIYEATGSNNFVQ